MLASVRVWRDCVFVGFLLSSGCSCEGDDDVTEVPDAAGSDASDDGTVLPPDEAILGIPETASFVLPELEGEVHVVRTEVDVPHVYASNRHDLRMVQGFVLARDRYFQIEAGRRLAQGRLAEVLGEDALENDQLSRGQGMSKVASRVLGLLTDEQRAEIDAYRIGVNAYIQLVKDRRIEPPSVFQVAAPVLGESSAGGLMEPLTLEDLVAFMAVPIYQLGFEEVDPLYQQVLDRAATVFTGSEREAARRRAGVLEDIIDEVEPLFPVVSAPDYLFAMGDPAMLLPQGGSRRGPEVTVGEHRPVRVERETLARLADRLQRFKRVALGGRGPSFGSNAWAVMSRKTADGATLLAGDGHLPLTVAPLFFQMGLDTSVFGDGDTTLMGLFFAGIPQMAVGTNGRIAWSQTYLRGDITDWYAEALQLDATGRPSTSTFQGEQRPLVVVDEQYVVADRPGLMSEGRTETWARYETFDGRLIASIEGRVVMAGESAPAGKSVVNVLGQYVIPEDTDGDGTISAISFDFVAFDVSNLLRALQGFNDANDVLEFREASKELVSYAQNLVAADIDGNVYYSAYNAMPCRRHLPRDPATLRWMEGANPRALIDGTQYGGFTVPLDANGMPDETQGREDPSKCLVPFRAWPAVMNPTEGFVLTANNDIANITTDGNFFNDAWYIGGPWNNGFRAQTIQARLLELGRDSTATLEAMAALQGDHHSGLARELGSQLTRAVDVARTLADATGNTPDEQRLADLYKERPERFDDIAARIEEWLGAGAEAVSGVDTFYHSASGTEERFAVATMVFNQWFREMRKRVFDDEGIDDLFFPDGDTIIVRLLHRMWNGRGPEGESLVASWVPATEESAFFDDLRTAAVVESSNEIALLALGDTLDALAAEPTAPGVGGFGTAEVDRWLWGLRHQVKFDSIVLSFIGTDPAFAALANGFSITPANLPLAEGLDDTDPRASAPWFPRPGDQLNVDAADYTLRGDGDYFYADGPVMRMVIRLEPGNVGGVNILPGGQTDRTSSDHFADQAALWLGNDTVPLRFEVADVIEGAVGRERFHRGEEQ